MNRIPRIEGRRYPGKPGKVAWCGDRSRDSGPQEINHNVVSEPLRLQDAMGMNKAACPTGSLKSTQAAFLSKPGDGLGQKDLD